MHGCTVLFSDPFKKNAVFALSLNRHLTFRHAMLKFRRMEIHLAPDTEAQLQHLATSQGKNAAQVVEEAVTRMLERQSEFVEGVQRGIEAAMRGDVISHEEVVARVDRLFRS